ncbi:MAG: hypothetical protein FJW30_18915 [Acidobacteria bacterium]|nr:hypothetical protein [Acidobacteriota bacterium]
MQRDLDQQTGAETSLPAEQSLRSLSETGQPGVAGPAEETGSRSIWAPSLTDFLFFSLIIWLFLAGPNGWAALLSDGDTGWHIRVGDWILQNRAFPRVDFLSFTMEGKPWFAWEWLAEVWMSALHSWAGMKGVVWGLGLLIPAYLMIGFRHALWRGAEPLVALPILLVASGSSAIHFLARPHIFTLFFLSISLWVIQADRRRASNWLWMLVPLTALWTNLHGGFLAVVMCLGMAAAGSALEKRWDRTVRYASAGAACFAVSLANPYGYHLHEHIFVYLRSDWIKEVVDEFQSPSFRSEAMFMYEALLFVSLITIYRAVKRGEWVDTFLVLGWAHFSLTSVRHVPIFLLVAGPIVASELSIWWRESVIGLPKRSLSRTFAELSRDLRPKFAGTSVWVLVPVIALAFLENPISWPRTFPEVRFPVEFIERHKLELEAKRVLTTDEWGDYLSYRFYPNQRVFFDGRSDFFGEALGKDYLSLLRGGADSEQRIEKFQFEAALLPLDWPIHLMLRKDPRWRVVEENKRLALFVRVLDPPRPAF